jgi:di/tricarboxylate transporter
MLLQTLSVLSFYMVILLLILGFVSCWRYWSWFESHKKKRIVNFFRRAYVWVLIHSAWAMVISYFINSTVWICMGLIFATAVLIHQKLLPAITNAHDGGDRKKWQNLIALSVLITLVQAGLLEIATEYL